MVSLPAARAASNPIQYLNTACAHLAQICRDGAPAADVDELLSGVVPAFEALHVPRGASIRVRVFPAPWGWSSDFEEDSGARIRFDEASDASARDAAGAVQPAFWLDEDVGLLFASSGGRWRPWNPADGPAPAPDRDRLRVKMVVLHRETSRVTVCRFVEQYGRDLPVPLHKTRLHGQPASATDTDRILEVLRGLLDAPTGGA